MLKIVSTTSFKHRVNVSLPSEDPDKPITGNFVATFKRISKERLADLNKRDDEQGADFLDEVLLGVDGIVDDAGQPIPSADAVALVKSDLAISSQTVEQYIQASLGVGAKNSVKSRGR